jgi:hypothetical protein
MRLFRRRVVADLGRSLHRPTPTCRITHIRTHTHTRSLRQLRTLLWTARHSLTPRHVSIQEQQLIAPTTRERANKPIISETAKDAVQLPRARDRREPFKHQLRRRTAPAIIRISARRQEDQQPAPLFTLHGHPTRRPGTLTHNRPPQTASTEPARGRVRASIGHISGQATLGYSIRCALAIPHGYKGLSGGANTVRTALDRASRVLD